MKAVNLLPSAQRGSTKTQPAAAITAPSGGSSFGAWLLIGALCVAVACSAAYVLTKNTINERQAKLQSITAEAAATKSQAAALQSFADFQTLATQRVATVKGLADSRFDWEKTLRDLSRALPTDVYIQQLSGTTGAQSGAGSTSAPSAIVAPSLHMTGCTRSQSSVARLMSRLRIVRGVTRVALAKSDKDGSVSALAGGTSTGATPAQPCPKGQPPAFDVTIYFERAALSAGATPNLGTTQAPATGSTTTAPGGSATQAPGASASPQAGGTSTAPNTAASAVNSSNSTTQPVSNSGATTQGGAK